MNYNNIIVPKDFYKESIPYRGVNPPIPESKYNYPTRKSFPKHVKKLTNEYEKVIESISNEEINVVVEVAGQEGKDTVFENLDNLRDGIRILNLYKRKDKKNISEKDRAIIKIPSENKNVLIKKFEKALTDNKESSVDYKIANTIEKLSRPTLESYWTSSDPIPSGMFFVEVWIMNDYYSIKKSFRNNSAEEDFLKTCEKIGIEYVSEDRLKFNEIIIRLIKTNKEQLEQLIEISDFISEIRLHKEPNSFFSELNSTEQEEWINDFLTRVYPSKETKSYISILDKGINRHSLLNDYIILKDAVDKSWGWYDDQLNPHGTYMAGICLFNDLNILLSENEEKEIEHKLESIKILPDVGKGQNEKHLYGDITNRAISILDIENPNVNRVVCMAVTAEDDKKDGSPSSWSAEIDKIVYDNELLFIISGGNIHPETLEEGIFVLGDEDVSAINDRNMIENPGQAWNALTVGGYTDLDLLSDNEGGALQPLVLHGDLSPYSKTSTLWDITKWPVKPDIVFESGNAVINKSNNTIESSEDLSLMTTSSTSLIDSFKFVNGTSPATAQASYMAANIMNKYPDLWPQTIRGLIVHSADWTKKMKSKYLKNHRKYEYENLIKKCGYGVPSLYKAINTVENRINLIIEDKIRPFEKRSMNVMHLHEIPWPEEVLRELGSIQVTMKITLSYFIEPYPGETGWKNKYRYASAGLRFDVKSSVESKDEFIRRINVASRNPNEKESFNSESDRWTIGKKTRNSLGSIHKDIWVGNAVDLSDCKYIAVYPVIGWWREIPTLKKYNNDLKYSLIVSIETDEEEVDLYTPIKNQINIHNQNIIEIN